MSGLAILALLPLLAWIYLLTLHGGFWRARPCLDRAPGRLSEPLPSVVAVVPARNEADVIGAAVQGLLAQDYPGSLRILIVDDQSEDDTAAQAEAAAQAFGTAAHGIAILATPTRPTGWVGKLWALESGCRSLGEPPDYWWFTDADIGHAPDTLGRLVAEARSGQRSQVSLMVRLSCASAWERLLIPAFVFFFQKLYPFPWVCANRRDTSAAAGGCMLVRTDDFAAAGGFPAMRGAVIDDCTLAANLRPAARRAGRGLYLGLTLRSHSLRPYSGLGEIWRMVARSAYTQLRYSPLLLVATLLGMALLYLAPPALLLVGALAGDGPAAVLGGLTWLLMALAWVPTLRLYGLGPWRGLLLPLAGLLYSAMTFDSGRRHWQGKGAAWKGRVGAGKTPSA
ncbi:MAG: glycosyltransferase [Rhodospirillales bacterium]